MREGYKVYVAIDACADFNPMITDVATQRLAAAGAIVTTRATAACSNSSVNRIPLLISVFPWFQNDQAKHLQI
ncbi:hypothetical protein [Actibacterium sp. 188UL27-1]|uniref:hypothetical protein n=1 Tax=Actibacterium sp. 188UL27-1 TaxID=2786961 RepID=UPI00351C432F